MKSAFLDDPEIQKYLRVYKSLEDNKDLPAKIGPRGFDGERGPKGEKGDKGDIGPQGEQGTQGEQGKSIVGPRGEQGPQGEKGDSLAPVQITQVVKEELTLTEDLVKEFISIMKKLPEKDRLEISNLRNAQSFLFNGIRYKIEELMRGAGGSTGATLSSETPVGAVNGVNTVYTVTHTPVFVVIDGLTRNQGYGYTYVAPTITVDPLTPPVQNIVSFYNA